jgi:metal-responsive CopG/Arc/MetJ family transcriptional regulator
MGRAAKVTISLPEGVLDQVERERNARDETRSEFILRAVEDYLRRERERRDVEQYIRGYQEFPEAADEELMAWVEAGYAGLAHAFRDEEPWPEESEEAERLPNALP